MGNNDARPGFPDEWKIGTSTCLFHDFSEKDLEACKEAGLSCIEVLFMGSWFKREVSERELFCNNLASKGKELGLEFWSVHLPFGTDWDISSLDEEVRKNAILKHEELLKLAAVFNPRKAVIHPSYGVKEENLRESRLANCRKSLVQLAEKAHQLGIQLVVECLPRTCLCNTTDEMQNLIERIDLLGVCCDMNHMLKDTTESFIDGIGSRISSIHVSDYDRVDEKHWLPGLGVNNWNNIIDALVNIGYQGPFMFEVSNPEGKIMPVDLKQCWDRLLKEYEGSKR